MIVLQHFNRLEKGATGLAILAIVLLPNITAQADIISNLQGHWTFDDGTPVSDLAKDSSPNNLSCTNNSVTQSTPGKIGAGSGNFGTDTDAYYIAVPNTSVLSPGTGNFTVSAWINLTTNGWNRVYSDRNSKAASNVLNLGLKFDGKLNGYFSDKEGDKVDINGRTALAGAWHHIVAVRNGTMVKLYVDGVYDAWKSNANLGDIDVYDAADTWLPNIGADSKGPTSGKSGGLIDDVRFYTRALSDGGGLSIGDTAGGDIAELYGYVPEPSTFALAAIGLLLGLGLYARRLWK